MKRLSLGVLLLLLAGCAQKPAPLTPLDEDARIQVSESFAAFSQRQCPGNVDADAQVQMNVPGEDILVSGILMAARPGKVHFRVSDPLGRAVMMLVSDGDTFTFADNREGEAYVGRTDSDYWSEYVPQGVEPSDLFNWLSGNLPSGDFTIRDIGKTETEPYFWLVLDYGFSREHHVGFDPQKAAILRHILVEGGEKKFDVLYSYPEQKTAPCLFPEKLEIEGPSPAGRITLQFEKIYSHEPIEPEKFQLTLPKHYVVHPVE